MLETVSGTEELLTAAVRDVVETMFFVEVLGTEPQCEADPSHCWFELQFHGSPSGMFRMALPSGTIRSIAANFLGEDESDLSEAQATSVACELLNMVAGAALSRIESDVTFDLCPPHSVVPVPQAIDGNSPEGKPVECTLQLDCGSIYVAFLAQEPA